MPGDENRTDVQLLGGMQALAVDNLPKEGVTVNEAPDVKEPSLPTIGFYLSKFVLYIIAGFIVLFTLFLIVQTKSSAAATALPDAATVSDSVFNRRLELVRLAQEDVKADRAYNLQIAQMILLNLLLPVLTAILGYIFGSNRSRD